MLRTNRISKDPSPYHVGEQHAQTRVGVRDIAERIGRAYIRKYLTDQAKEFYNELPFLNVGTRAPDGSIWATTLCGIPGFIKATDDHHFAVDLKQIYGDPIKFAEGDLIGSVGVMLHNRRRNRLNCLVESLQPGACTLKVLQSFGNCPKYIQVRRIVVDADELATLGEEERPVTEGTTVLGPEQRALIARSDTLFLATGFSGLGDGADGVNGCDCNHRGGAPGFVEVSGDGTLQCPDYVGNNMFCSFGNVMLDCRVGIQFIDFTNGDSLQLTGHGKILFDERSLPGAQRTLEFVTCRWVHVKGGLPISTEGPVQLTWTISSHPQQIAATGKFTISVKKAGLVSTHLHDKVQVMNELIFRGVDGDFTLDKAAKCIPAAGVLLVAGGIGITPMRTIFAECIKRGIPVTLLYTVRHLEDAAFLAEFQEGAAAHDNVKVALTLSAATGGLIEGAPSGVTTLSGRVSAAMIQQVCPDVSKREVFQCGPDTMMDSVMQALLTLGLSSAQVHQESFSF
ncbi:hypothetical protein WJX75_009774 [Coccomyxa subellipsoidea]|uniref:Oxidoreductase FAD/NAD(P)-binding domain-containing protein n=1 Tax=Coccomyxa subellipsoidea TaxID=248742 RepID=A0ABR2YB66_9CHLO